MKKLLRILLPCIILLIGLFVFLNINVTTQQGINYRWQTIRIPLYLKILDFFDRHYNYKELVKRIVKDAKTDEERVLKIFEWTHANIKKVPNGFPTIDDHVWHIIVRGYGADDQSSDVFTTLCNYVGIDAFFSWVYTRDKSQRIPLSFVKIEKKWFIFDPYHGIYFKDKKGGLADINILKSNNWTPEGNKEHLDIDYAIYFDNLPLIKDAGLKRANIQSPLNRLIFEIKRWIR